LLSRGVSTSRFIKTGELEERNKKNSLVYYDS